MDLDSLKWDDKGLISVVLQDHETGDVNSLAVENLFDVEAQDLLFYPRPGRWVSASMAWSVPILS